MRFSLFLLTISPEHAPLTFRQKPEETQQLINEALLILNGLGLPLAGLTPRRRERIALMFLAGGWVCHPRSICRHYLLFPDKCMAGAIRSAILNLT